jgi:predicted flavoprotein YhiN
MVNLKDPDFKRLEDERINLKMTPEKKRQKNLKKLLRRLKPKKKLTKAAIDRIQELRLKSILEDVKMQKHQYKKDKR